MAFTTSPNLWAGEYVIGVNTAAVLGGDTVQAGLWRVEQGYEDKAIIKLFNYTSNLQAATLCTATESTSGAMADLAIQLTTLSIKDKVCKHDFDNTNYAMYQNRGVFNKVIPREVLEAYISQMTAAEAFNLEVLRWVGDTTSLDPLLSIMDGIITLAVADGSYVPVTPTSATASQVAATVIAEINKVLQATPAKVRMQPNFKLVVSPKVAFAYQEAVAANTSLAMWQMGNPTALQQPISFIGYFGTSRIPMYIAPGVEGTYDELIMAGDFSNDIKGNLIFVTDAISDAATIHVQDRQAIFENEPFVDITWSFRQGVIAARYDEIVLYIN
jgi:hypothetical protein